MSISLVPNLHEIIKAKQMLAKSLNELPRLKFATIN